MLLGGLPAGRVDGMGTAAACCGGNWFRIIQGDLEVLIDGKPAPRRGDRTQHRGGVARMGTAYAG